MKLCASSQFPFVCLGDCGEVVTGSTPPKANSDYWGGEIPFVTPAQLGFQPPITTADEYVTSEGADHGRLLPEGAVLVCCIGSLGKTGTAGVPLISNQQINAIIFDPIQVDARYGYHAARSLTPLLEHFAPSTTVKIVKKSAFAEFQIPLPPLAEQKRIAGILDAADALRAKRREALGQLDTLLQSTFLDMFGDPVTNPMGWDTSALGEVGEVITGNTPSRKHPEYYGEDIEWIKSDNINDPSFVLTEAEERLSVAGKAVARTSPRGSILVTCIAGSPSCIGNAAIADREVAFNQQINAFVPGERIALWFAFGMFWVGKRLVQSASTSSMKGMVSKSAFSAISIPIPPTSLQSRFDAIGESVEHQKASQRAHLAELDTLFTSLQSRAFRGDL